MSFPLTTGMRADSGVRTPRTEREQPTDDDGATADGGEAGHVTAGERQRRAVVRGADALHLRARVVRLRRRRAPVRVRLRERGGRARRPRTDRRVRADVPERGHDAAVGARTPSTIAPA